jgi:DHA2 family multidrug resistance protein
LRGIGQQFAVPPIVTMALGSLPQSRLKSASGLFNLMRNLGGAIGIALCGTILNDRANLHFLRIAEHLNATNAAMQQMLHQVGAKFAAAAGGDTVHGQAAALRELWALAWREAQVQTYADAFLALAGCLAVATVMVPLLRRVAPPSAPSADAH